MGAEYEQVFVAMPLVQLCDKQKSENLRFEFLPAHGTPPRVCPIGVWRVCSSKTGRSTDQTNKMTQSLKG